MTDRDALVTKQIENALDFLPHTGDYIWHRLSPSAVDVIRTALRAAAEALAVPPQDRDISQSEHEDDLRDAKALELRYSYGELTDLRAYPLPSETRTHPSAAPTLPTETQAGRSPMTDRDAKATE